MISGKVAEDSVNVGVAAIATKETKGLSGAGAWARSVEKPAKRKRGSLSTAPFFITLGIQPCLPFPGKQTILKPKHRVLNAGP
jgi:hypothetical protein